MQDTRADKNDRCAELAVDEEASMILDERFQKRRRRRSVER